MDTIKKYQANVYLKDDTAKITDIIIDDETSKTLVTLDSTIFFPTGGGQSCDLGFIGGFPVTDVYEEGSQIFHEIDVNYVDRQRKLSIGDEVAISIDWPRRFDNMQRHCGEHILSGMFYKYYGGVNRGFHMGDQYMTIDIALEENPEFDKITWDMAKHVEFKTNQAIWENQPVITRYFQKGSDATKLPLRKALALEEDVTIVCVGDINSPSDCVACCGTHPSTAGQVGMVKIYKVENNKGMFRIYFEAGQRAFLGYQNKFDVLTSLENRLSAGTDDLMDKYIAGQEKNKAVRDELYHLKKWVIKGEIQKLSDVINEKIVEYYDILSIDDLLAIGRELAPIIPKLLFLVHVPSNTVLLFSAGKPPYDCGKLVKENANIYNGKGGGNNTSARAIFSKADYVDTFIDLLCKHLQ